MTGVARGEFIQASIEGAADLLVLCLVGPKLYDRGYGIAATEVIEDLARTWIADGPEGSIELQLMQTVNQSGNLNLEFANAFKSERARQNREILEQKQADEARENSARVTTAEGYAQHSARFAALRAEVAAQRPASIAITVKRRMPTKAHD